jgi:hypothetical protein
MKPWTDCDKNKNSEFQAFKLNTEGVAKAHAINATFDACLNALKPLCASGDYFGKVAQRLEEACFYAKKSMAAHPENHEQSV